MKKIFRFIFIVIFIIVCLILGKKNDEVSDNSKNIVQKNNEINIVSNEISENKTQKESEVTENSNEEKSDELINDINIENTTKVENNSIEKKQDTSKKIEKIKKEINSNADTQIYQLEKEPGGREIIQIKPEAQYEVDLAGIVKNSKPEENEVKELAKKVPNKSGIWISESSREKFNQLLAKNNVSNFKIENDGYLTKKENNENHISKSLENMVESNKLYIINIKGTSYERDYISGKIVEYPFEDMDPNQILEPYIENDRIILEITSNKKQKITDKEILEAITKF